MKITKIAANISYTGIVPLDSISGNTVISSQSVLSNFQVPEGWKVFANHITLNLGAAKDKSLIGQEVTFTLTDVAQDDKVMAAKASISVPSMNNLPHITIAVNINNGGKPVMSNNLSNWKSISPITLKGKILEVMQDGTFVV